MPEIVFLQACPSFTRSSFFTVSYLSLQVVGFVCLLVKTVKVHICYTHLLYSPNSLAYSTDRLNWMGSIQTSVTRRCVQGEQEYYICNNNRNRKRELHRQREREKQARDRNFWITVYWRWSPLTVQLSSVQLRTLCWTENARMKTVNAASPPTHRAFVSYSVSTVWLAEAVW